MALEEAMRLPLTPQRRAMTRNTTADSPCRKKGLEANSDLAVCKRYGIGRELERRPQTGVFAGEPKALSLHPTFRLLRKALKRRIMRKTAHRNHRLSWTERQLLKFYSHRRHIHLSARCSKVRLRFSAEGTHGALRLREA